MDKKQSWTGVLWVAGSIAGLVSVYIAIMQYNETKKMRKMQEELTALQLEEARSKAAAKTAAKT